MDCLIEGEREYIDLEMQLYEMEHMVKRVRYYHSAMDVESARKGIAYGELKDSIVIFIFMNEDPFKMRKTVYKSRTMLTNCGNMIVEDGVYSYYVNFSKERDDSGVEDIEALAKYFGERKIDSELTAEIDRMLVDLNDEPVWRQEAMTLEELLDLAGKQAAKEARKKALEEGEQAAKEARKEIQRQLISKMQEDGYDVQSISGITGWPVDEIESLRNELTMGFSEKPDSSS